VVGVDANVGGVFTTTIILNGKFCTGLIPSLNDATTEYVPEFEVVGNIEYV
jgi:hypothetical protein